MGRQLKKASINRECVIKAVKKNDAHTLEFLVEQCEADLRSGYSSWEYPTRIACENRNAEMLRLLVNYKASLYDTDNIPVIFGILKNEQEDAEQTLPLLDIYVALGGSLDVMNEDKHSLIDKFIERGWWKLAARVVDHGGKSISKCIFYKDHAHLRAFSSEFLPVVLPVCGRYSYGYKVETLELVASHAWKFRPNSTNRNCRNVEMWARESDSIQSWIAAIQLRHECPQWHTEKEPYRHINLVSSEADVIACLHDHFHGGTDLLIQCLLLQERLLGTIDPTVAENAPFYGWKSAKQYINLMIYLTQFDVDMNAALILPNRCIVDTSLSHVISLLHRIISHCIDPWESGAVHFLLNVFDEDRYCRHRLRLEARNLDSQQRNVLETLISRQPWIEDYDAQLVKDLLPAIGNSA